MSIIDELITDRTQADVTHWKKLHDKGWAGMTDEEKAEWSTAAMKGAYNYTDLNRVTEAMDYLENILSRYGYKTGYKKIVVSHTDSGELPDGYTRLEYIESSGDQYIDTGVIPNNNTRVLCTISNYPKTKHSQAVFGARTSLSASDSFTFITSSSSNAYRSDYASEQKDFSSSINYTDLLTIDKNKNTCTLNSKDTVVNIEADFTCAYSLFLFAANTGGTATVRTNGVRLHSCKIYNNDSIVRDFIPCKNSNGIIGLYDKISSKIFENDGTGAFKEGPIVSDYGNDENTLLLLHGETLTDSSSRSIAITNNSVKISEEQSKFNGKSLYFDGTSSLAFNVDSLNILKSPFTIDAWVYPLSRTNDSFFLSGQGQNTGFFGLVSTGKLGIGRSGVAWDSTSTKVIPTNQWTHIAVVKTQTSVMFFVNGELSGSISNSIDYTLLSGLATIGSQNNNYYFNGYIDEFRISNVIRWTENFVPPTEPYKSPPEEDLYTWRQEDVPTTVQMEQYLSNLQALKSAIILLQTTPTVPSTMTLLNYTVANQIEQILIDIDHVIKVMESTFIPCGFGECGEDYI